MRRRLNAAMVRCGAAAATTLRRTAFAGEAMGAFEAPVVAPAVAGGAASEPGRNNEGGMSSSDVAPGTRRQAFADSRAPRTPPLPPQRKRQRLRTLGRRARAHHLPRETSGQAITHSRASDTPGRVHEKKAPRENPQGLEAVSIRRRDLIQRSHHSANTSGARSVTRASPYRLPGSPWRPRHARWRRPVRRPAWSPSGTGRMQRSRRRMST